MVFGTDSYLQTDLMPEKGSTFVKQKKTPPQNQKKKPPKINKKNSWRAGQDKRLTYGH